MKKNINWLSALLFITALVLFWLMVGCSRTPQLETVIDETGCEYIVVRDGRYGPIAGVTHAGDCSNHKTKTIRYR